MSKASDFIIEGGVLKEYTGRGGDVVVPDGVTSIGVHAFKRCSNLTSISFPKSLSSIGYEAFYDCWGLQTVRMASSVCSISDTAFDGCSAELCFEGLQGSNDDFIIENGILTKYVGFCNTVAVPEGVVAIGERGLKPRFQRLKSVFLPDTIQSIHKNAFVVPRVGDYMTRVPPANEQRMERMPKKMNIPKGFFGQKKGVYDPDMAVLLLNGPWKNEATFDDYVAIVKHQTSKSLLDLCFNRLSTKPSKAADMLIAELADCKNKDAFVRTAHFALENEKKLNKEQLGAIYQAAKKAKASAAEKLLEEYASGREDKPKSVDAGVKMNPLEERLRKNRSPYDLDMVLKKATPIETQKKNSVFDNFEFTGVKYAGSDKEVSAFVLKYVIAAYVGMLKERPRRGSMFYGRFEFDPAADEVAAEFDEKSFQTLIDRIEPSHETVAVKCRYGSEKEIVQIESLIKKGQKDKYETFSSVALEAILLSDTRRAMIIADEHRMLNRYAYLRHTTENALRDTKMFDFGFNAAYEKYYDIGSTQIKATLNRDLSLALYDVNNGKAVKSVPKRGADAEKLQAATDDIADLKKNIKKVIGNRKKELFRMFLSGDTIAANEWKSTYLGNPVFHRMAETIVWSQDEKTFILTENGAICRDGSSCTVGSKTPVGIAHPLFMEQRETEEWQKYMTDRGIKQPFIQVWEPVPALREINPDRYKGCMIEYCRFLGREQHGIRVTDNDFHNDIVITLQDCLSTVKRIDWHRHEIAMSDRFEVESIQPKDSRSRMANHVIAYLDRITMLDRIRKDDLSVSDFLPGCNIAQIADYINCAQEANATNVLAALLEYKNAHFADFDPMAEFTLEW